MTFPNRRGASFDGVRYAPGRRFRVIMRGAQLVGMAPEPGYPGGAWRGWEQKLKPGDIVTCTGFGAGWGGDPGYGVEFTSDKAEAAHAGNCEIRPMAGGIFSYRPAPGVLEPDEEASQ